jgi:hypothetical protein
MCAPPPLFQSCLQRSVIRREAGAIWRKLSLLFALYPCLNRRYHCVPVHEPGAYLPGLVDDLAMGQRSLVIQHEPEDYDCGASIRECFTLAKFGHQLLDRF